MIKEAAREIKDLDLDNLDRYLEELKTNFRDNRTQDLTFRRAQLNSLLKGVNEMEKEFLDALYKDLKMDETTAYTVNMIPFKNDIKECIRNLSKWSAPQLVATPLTTWPGKSHIKPQPKGAILIMSSWNFPVTTMNPFVNAIAAGNCVLVKPSEFSANTSHVYKKLFEKYLDNRYYKCVEGGVPTSIKLTNQPWDLICFTGSTFTGKLIAKAASAHLTPLILELGGKCPAVVDRAANISLAAKR
jgi:aldehyde dehydrogenase (NAD+)